MPITKDGNSQKVRVQLCLDRDLVEAFRSRSDGQSLSGAINTILAMFLKGDNHERK